MLEQVDLKMKMEKSEYKARVSELAGKLRELQTRQWQSAVPITILFEGWDCAGKGESISLLAEILDPRGFKMHPIFEPNREESSYPFLWRFWTKIPARGEIALFDRSWYQRVLTDRVDKTVKKHEWKSAFEQINCFERKLSDDGMLIIKFFLHISKQEQRRRFRVFEADPHERWRVRKEDWDHHHNYDVFVEATEEMFLRTNTKSAPWIILPAENLRYARARVLEEVHQRIDNALRRAGKSSASQTNPLPPSPEAFARTNESKPALLDRVDLSLKSDPATYKKELRALQTRLRELTWEMYQRKIPSVVVYQGWDAAGKGGNIRRLTARLDPRVYDVHSISKPNAEENKHHYLWRFWKQLPRDGHMAIFDRSWYGRVLVERVEGFCSEAEWRRAFQEINEFEEQLAVHGMVLVKFFIHVDQEEQARRFQAREDTPHKRWKIGEEDWRNREKWEKYEHCFDEMFQKTSTADAPWIIIPGRDKKYARLMAIRALIERLEARLGEE